jgi:hypothetical protein
MYFVRGSEGILTYSIFALRCVRQLTVVVSLSTQGPPYIHCTYYTVQQSKLHNTQHRIHMQGDSHTAPLCVSVPCTEGQHANSGSSA